MAKWFYFDQNNSGGSFDHDASQGIGYGLFIEATDAGHANYRAESIGLYFNGCDEGVDCECCGDRWSPASESDAADTPSRYGKNWRPVAEGEEPTLEWGIPLYIHPMEGPFVAATLGGSR